jgi:hypothetical protein
VIWAGKTIAMILLSLKLWEHALRHDDWLNPSKRQRIHVTDRDFVRGNSHIE